MHLLNLFGIKTRAQKVKEALGRGAIIVDVRTPQEFGEGHIANSINVPLQNLETRISMIKKKNKPVITCCRSGSRSGRAKNILLKHDIECINGGGWGSLNYLIH